MNEYYFSTAQDPYRNGERKIIREENLLKFVRSNVDFRRKSLLTLLNVNRETAERVANMFKGSKVFVKTKTQ